MERLTWEDLLIQTFTTDDARRWLLPWAPIIGGAGGVWLEICAQSVLGDRNK